MLKEKDITDIWQRENEVNLTEYFTRPIINEGKTMSFKHILPKINKEFIKYLKWLL